MGKEIIINKDTKINLGGLMLKNGLVQGDRYRFFPTHTKKKYIQIQVCKNNFVVFSCNFFIGSQKKVLDLQKECMELFSLKHETM